MIVFVATTLLDVLSSILLTTTIIPSIASSIDSTMTLPSIFTTPFIPGQTLSDYPILSAVKLTLAAITMSLSAMRYRNKEELRPEMTYSKPNLTKVEKEEESLEESWSPYLRRFTSRPMFIIESSCTLTLLYLCVKCMSRLLAGADQETKEWVWWTALSLSCTFTLIQISTVGYACDKVAGKLHKTSRSRWEGSDVSLRDPLLGSDTAPSTAPSSANSSKSGSPTVGNNVGGGKDAGFFGNKEGEGGERISEVPESDIGPDAKDYKAGWTDLLRVCYPDIHLILFAFLNLTLAAVAQVYIPHFTGKILDSLGADGGDGAKFEGNVWDVPGFSENVRLLAIAAVACGFFSGARGSTFTVVGGRVNARLRNRLMNSLLAQDIGFFDVTKTGDITSRLCSDTTLVGDQVTLNVNVFLRSFVQAIGVLIFMFSISWSLSLMAFVSVPAITVMSKWYGQYIRKLTKLTQKKLADANGVSEAAIGSMPTVKAFGAEESELQEYGKFIDRYLVLNNKSAFAYLWYCSAITSLPQLVTALVLLYGGVLIQSDEITGGQLVSFLLYLSSLSDAFNMMGSIFSSLTQAVGAADKVFELMHRKPKVKPWSGKEAGEGEEGGGITKLRGKYEGDYPDCCNGEVKLDSVTMFYPARPKRKVLDGMDFVAHPGDVVALVGPSGGGKSSVISLIQHLYEATEGKICIDGNQVHELAPDYLTRNITVVSQEPTLYARSVARNIMFGLEGGEFEPTLGEIKDAARLANAHTFIEGLPEGYDTEVGERGVQLSGGQKQRIAIARALVRKPKILLLDEATSALDAESEALVQEAIDNMLGKGEGGDKKGEGRGMTVIVVAHRLSTVRNADNICVVKAGSIVEVGKHDELIKKEGGQYANLVKRQMNAEDKLNSK